MPRQTDKRECRSPEHCPMLHRPYDGAVDSWCFWVCGKKPPEGAPFQCVPDRSEIVSEYDPFSEYRRY